MYKYDASNKSRKLCNGVPVCEKSNGHRECYLAWCEFERRLSLQGCNGNHLEVSINAKS